MFSDPSIVLPCAPWRNSIYVFTHSQLEPYSKDHKMFHQGARHPRGTGEGKVLRPVDIMKLSKVFCVGDKVECRWGALQSHERRPSPALPDMHQRMCTIRQLFMPCGPLTLVRAWHQLHKKDAESRGRRACIWCIGCHCSRKRLRRHLRSTCTTSSSCWRKHDKPHQPHSTFPPLTTHVQWGKFTCSAQKFEVVASSKLWILSNIVYVWPCQTFAEMHMHAFI